MYLSDAGTGQVIGCDLIEWAGQHACWERQGMGHTTFVYVLLEPVGRCDVLLCGHMYAATHNWA